MRIDLTAHVDHVRERVLQDALTQATAEYWLARSEVWERARPKRGDYFGQATREELRAADARCAETAENCRRHAALLLEGLHGPITDEVATVLDEVRAAFEVAA